MNSTKLGADHRAGALVFSHDPIRHVGRSIGNGHIVRARTFGQPGAVTAVDQARCGFARRIVG